MKKRLFATIVTVFCVAIHLNAQSFLEKILGSVTQGAVQGIEIGTLKKYINDPSLQSADMQKYLRSYRNGDAYTANGDYVNALESYSAAWNTAVSTQDPYLKKLWSNYGWAKDTTDKMNKARSLVGYSSNNSNIGGYDAGIVNSYSSGSGTSSSSSSSSSSRVCSLCHGTGMKIAEHYGAGQRKYCSTCGKEVSTGHMHVRCDLCHGTGRLNY